MLQTSQTTPKHLSSVKKSSIKHSGASPPENSTPAADIDPDLFEATRSALDNAAREGVGKIAYGHPDHDFYEQLKHNNAVFAAFKTHRQQNELAALLVDENGTPKSFAQVKRQLKTSSATTTSTGSRPNTTPPSFVPGTPYNGGNSDGKKKPDPNLELD